MTTDVNVTQMRRIDALCDQIEAARKQDARLSIEEAARGGAESDRPLVVWELIAVEIENRRRDGEVPRRKRK